MLKYELFRYNIVVAAYLYVVSRAGGASGLAIASPLASLHEKQRTQIQDMLAQQYYKEKVHIFNT